MRLSEPRIRPLEDSEWTGKAAEMLPRFRRGDTSDGPVHNIFRTLARHPDLLRRWTVFGNHVLSKSTLPSRDREILILRIGWLCQSEYEFGQHTRIGREVGITDEEILRITVGPDVSEWDPFEASLLRAADELHDDAMVSNETWQRLSERYDNQQMLDVLFTVGQYNMVSMVLNSAGVQLDEGVPHFPTRNP